MDDELSDIDIFEDDRTPVELDPCFACGSETAWVKFDEPPPDTSDIEELWKKHPNCESSRSGRWYWCARGGWLKLSFDRRTWLTQDASHRKIGP